MKNKLDVVDEKALLDGLISYFGITSRIRDGGYLLPDGRFLDLQRSDLDKRQYHRAIAACIPEELIGKCDEITIVNVLAATGVIRYESSGRVHVAKAPTMIQRRKLFDLMKYSVHRYQVIVSDINGATIGERFFQSPQAHELLNFFNECFSTQAQQYRDDEFYSCEREGEFVFIFRTDHRVIGHYVPETDQFTIEPSFQGALPLFESQVRALLYQS